MSQINFKNSEILSTWQWGTLVGFCLLLVVIMIIVKRFGNKKPQGLLDRNPNFIISSQRVSQSLTVHSIEYKEMEAIVLESNHGVIQLNLSQKKEINRDVE